MIPTWFGQYTGRNRVPFKVHGSDHAGADCWGLVALVYREQFAIELPTYDDQYESMVDFENRAAAFETHATDDFTTIAAAERKPGDCLLVYARGLPLHVGIYAGDGFMLHTTASRGHSMLERVNGSKYERAIRDTYRHRLRAGQLA